MKIAVIGLGFMGATHLRAWRKVAGAEVVAVVSGNDKKLSGDLRGVWGNSTGGGELMDFTGMARYRTLEECLRDPNIEAVDVCVPTDAHAEASIAALRAGKHVLVEKPLARDGDSADRMIAEAQRAGRTLMCAQVLRFMADYRTAADELRRLGAVRAAAFVRRCGFPGWNGWMGDRARSGGAAFDLLIHDIDYCVGLWGRPESVAAHGFEDRRLGIDLLQAELRYGDGKSVAIEGGWVAPQSYPFRAEFTMMAEEGTLEYGSEGRPLAILEREGQSLAVDVKESDAFADELQYFVECANAGAEPERCPPRDSAMAVRLVELILESRKRDGERILCST